MEIGCGISEEYRGRGYAGEAVSVAATWALNRPGAVCVTAEAEAENLASLRVLKKCGFVPTGEIGVEGVVFIKRL